MSRELFERAYVELAAKYPQALWQRIAVLGEVTKQGGYTSRATFQASHRVPITKHRMYTLTCGHTYSDSCGGREALPKRVIGDREPCLNCAPDGEALFTPSTLLHKMAVRTRAPWVVILQMNAGPYGFSKTAWEQLKPLLLPEIRDPRLDEFFEATAQWPREHRESEDTMYARRTRLLPAVLDVVLRDPVQETK